MLPKGVGHWAWRRILFQFLDIEGHTRTPCLDLLDLDAKGFGGGKGDVPTIRAPVKAIGEGFRADDSHVPEFHTVLQRMRVGPSAVSHIPVVEADA